MVGGQSQSTTWWCRVGILCAWRLIW